MVRDLTARRAGFRCSIPGCGRITVGPGERADQHINVGIAAHIYGASRRGPRGSSGLREDELRSATNAIWLCAHHASLVDKNDGADYPPELLLRYRDIHEARIVRELQGISTPLGWITALHVEASPVFAAHTAISLGKVTLFIGDNDTGKTALAEWLAGASEAKYLKRWQPSAKAPDGLRIRVDYLDPDPHSVRVVFPQGGFPQYFLDGRPTMVPIAPLKVFYPKDVGRYGHTPRANDLHFLMEMLDLTEHEILALAEEMPKRGTGNITALRFERYGERCRLYADVDGGTPDMPFGNLGGSEQTRLLTEFCILAAKEHARLHPTLLILEAGSSRFDSEWLATYGKILASPEMGFQTIAAIVPRDDMEELQWAGWSVVRLKGKPPAVELSGEIRLATNDFEWKLD